MYVSAEPVADFCFLIFRRAYNYIDSRSAKVATLLVTFDQKLGPALGTDMIKRVIHFPQYVSTCILDRKLLQY